MIRKFVLPFLALAGAGLGILAAVRSASTLVPNPMVSDAPTPPYQTFVAGAGMVEANTENIAIGTQIAGIVAKIYVDIGGEVKTGDPLFTIDDRAQAALVAVKKAVVKVAQTQLDHAKYQENLGAELTEKKVLSVEDQDTRHQTVQTVEAQLVQAQADLLAVITDLERLTVRAPVDGQIMQLKLHLGEFAPTGVLLQPLMLLGGIKPMNVRVDVDENEAWRVHAGAVATGYLRGHKEVSVPLKFVRFEPYVIPKVSLTGGSTERVDTRVLQVIFSFDRGDQSIFVGAQMDIFIDAAEPKISATTAAGL
jgi:HlyD family secretion protein